MQTPIGKMLINIVGGNGKMGRVHKPVFEAAGHKVLISGRTSTPSIEDAAKHSDLTIISVPLDVTEEVIKKVAPHCTAIADFTSVKEMPVKTMLKYSREDCEVLGLHPLYGEIPSIKGETIIYCLTERKMDKTWYLFKTLDEAGAELRPMNPKSHDTFVNGLLQNTRTAMIQAYLSQVATSGLSIQDAYVLSPPPTRAILDLAARQFDESNDELYEAMKKINPNTSYLERELAKSLDIPLSPAQIRNFYGKELKQAQERAKKRLKI